MSKKTGQINYEIPEKTKDLCVSIDEPLIIADHGVVIEPMVSVKDGDLIIRLDPAKKL